MSPLAAVVTAAPITAVAPNTVNKRGQMKIHKHMQQQQRFVKAPVRTRGRSITASASAAASAEAPTSASSRPTGARARDGGILGVGGAQDSVSTVGHGGSRHGVGARQGPAAPVLFMNTKHVFIRSILWLHQPRLNTRFLLVVH